MRNRYEGINIDDTYQKHITEIKLKKNSEKIIIKKFDQENV